MVLIQDNEFRLERYAEPRSRPPIASSSGSTSPTWPACWTNAASICRGRAGQGTGDPGHRLGLIKPDYDTIVVPVPDTGKAAADAMAFELGLPSVEGLMRNRHIGRTFIEGNNRADRVKMKFTPLREVMEGKRVLLVEDSIVRSTTLKSLLSLIRDRGGAKEIHVRVACPPIVAPCFYGIDMSTVDELFAPHFMHGKIITLAGTASDGPRIGGGQPVLSAAGRCRPLHWLAGGQSVPCLPHRRLPDARGERLYPAGDPQSRRRRSGWADV